MPLDAVLRAGRRLQAEAPARFRLEAAGPLARTAEAPTAGDPWWDRGRAEREEQDRRLAAACQRLPGGVHGMDSWSYQGDDGVVVDVMTLRLSRAGAFELVRQALAACPDRTTNHPYTQHILAYLQTLGGSVDAAKLGQLEEMISFWRNRQYKVPKDVQEALLHHDKAKWGQFGGQEPTTDAFLFVLGCSLAAATTVPFLWWFFAAGALSAAGSRAVAMISGLDKQQKLRDYLTKSAAPDLQADTDKFTAPQLTRLFDWIAEFLSKAWAHHLQAAYTMPDRRLEVRVAYSDRLDGQDDAERIRGEMHKLVEDFARMPREQLPSAASLDAEFGLGEATEKPYNVTLIEGTKRPLARVEVEQHFSNKPKGVYTVTRKNDKKWGDVFNNSTVKVTEVKDKKGNPTVPRLLKAEAKMTNGKKVFATFQETGNEWVLFSNEKTADLDAATLEKLKYAVRFAAEAREAFDKERAPKK